MNSSKIVVIIPARLASTRLPGKPLIAIDGKPLVQYVWESAKRAEKVGEVWVATPDLEIMEAVERFDGRSILTAATHRSGTDRIAEAVDLLNLPDEALVINVQGDEPLLEPMDIEAAIGPLVDDPTLPMSSLMCVCPDEDVDNPSCVKVVCDLNGDALYFSRSRVPFARQPGGLLPMQHIGLYGYRCAFLRRFASLTPAPLESTESLEQLRALEHGYRIHMVQVAHAPIGVDTDKDLERVRRIIQG